MTTSGNATILMTRVATDLIEMQGIADLMKQLFEKYSKVEREAEIVYVDEDGAEFVTKVSKCESINVYLNSFQKITVYITIIP